MYTLQWLQNCVDLASRLLEFGRVERGHLVRQDDRRAVDARPLDQLLQPPAVGEGDGAHVAAAKTQAERLASRHHQRLTLPDLGPLLALAAAAATALVRSHLDPEQALLHAEAVVHARERDPLAR